MRTLKMTIVCIVFLLLGCEKKSLLSDKVLPLPPPHLQTERQLVFEQQIVDTENKYAISRDGNKLLITGDARLQVWDLQTKRMILEQPISNHRNASISCSFSFSGGQIILYGEGGYLTVYDLDKREFFAELTQVTYVSRNLKYGVRDNGHNEEVFATSDPEDFIIKIDFPGNDEIVFSANERYMLVGDYESGRTQVYDLIGKEMVFEDSLAWQSSNRVTVSNNGKRISIAGRIGGEYLMVVTVHGGDSATIATTRLAENKKRQGENNYGFSHNSRYLCVGSEQGAFRVYDCDNDLALVYEDTSIKNFSDKMIIDSTYITKLSKNDLSQKR